MEHSLQNRENIKENEKNESKSGYIAMLHCLVWIYFVYEIFAYVIWV